MKQKFSFSILIKTVLILFKSSALMSFLFILFELITCIVPILSSKLVSQLVDSFVRLNVNSVNTILRIVVFYIVLNVMIQIISPIRSYLLECFSDKIAHDSEMRFAEKLSTFFTIACFEDNKFYNDMQMAQNGCGIRLISSLQMLSSLFRGIITIAMTAGYMLGVNKIIGFISLAALIPNSVYNFWASKNRVNLFRSKTETTRKLNYYSSILHKPDYAKEVRLFNLHNYVLTKYHDLFCREYFRVNKIRRKQCVIGLAAGALSAFVNGSSVFLFVVMSVRGETSPGDIVLYISLLPQFIGGLQMLINGFSQTKENSYYIKYYLDFLERKIDEQNGKIMFNENKHICSIEAKNLSFRYPLSSHKALNNISFHIDSPSLVAVVGENGSGKSTMIKLLMRLFDVCEGKLLLNGIPIQEYDVKEVRAKMSGVFQDSAKFSFTVKENIMLSATEKKEDMKRVEAAAANADILELIQKLPNGYETILDKQFENGIDLSGGQWQRIALARAFYSDADIIFFDEASAELDPNAEAAFYKNVRQLAKNRIVFYVTHRLSGTKDADLILVFKEGNLVEMGKHETLIKKEGEYKRLYVIQASGYDMAFK